MSDPYFDYKDKVNYDYEFKVTQPIVLESDNYKNPRNIPEQQMIDVTDNIMKGIESLIVNEDYNKESFEELGLGRVYPGVNEVTDEYIEMYFGISLQDKEQEVDTMILEDDIKEYMNILDSNTEFDSSVSGWEHTGDDGTESVKLDYITFSCKGEPKIEILKQPSKKENKMGEKEIENMVKDIDKTLINEGTITFKNNVKQQIVEVKMNDDGVIEIYKENKLINTLPFAKLSLIRECKTILQDGFSLYNKKQENLGWAQLPFHYQDFVPEYIQGLYEDDELEDTTPEDIIDAYKNEFTNVDEEDIENYKEWYIGYAENEIKKFKENHNLEESTITAKDGEQIDTEKEKENIEQASKEIDEIQKMKDELEDKADKLFSENKIVKTESPVKVPEFPSTEFTQRKLTANELATIDLINNLTDEQKEYIDTYICNGYIFEDIKQLEWYLKNDYIDNFFPDLVDEPITSIDDYINGIYEIRKENNND